MANDFSKITIDGTTYNVKVPNKLTVGSKTFDGSSAVTIAASDLGLSNALQFIGETTETPLSDGSTTSSVKIGSTTHTAATGDVVLYGAKEFVWQGSLWRELGDGSSHALKSISISAGGGLTGGGTLEANRTISHADTSSQASVSASGRRYITGVTLDGYGHVTGLTTGTETVTAPTKVSELDNDSKFVTADQNMTIKWGGSINTNPAWMLAWSDSGSTIQGVSPSTITAGNATKLNGQAASYYAAASSVPTKTSQLTNDSGFKTTDNNTTYSLSKSGSTITLTGSDGSTTSVTDADTNTTYSFSASNPTLSWGTTSTIGTAGGTTYKVTMPSNPAPTKTSQLTNDSGFITSDGSVKSVIDYASADTRIKIGWTGNGLSGDNILCIAGYTSRDTGDNSVRIKDISKDALKSWLGYATVATSGAYSDLSGTPTIPTVNNGTLTIQKNGTSVGTFTANSSSNVTANITVPTKVSELTNDSGFKTTDNNTTYSLSKSGSTITLTGSDGSTTSVTDADTNTDTKVSVYGGTLQSSHNADYPILATASTSVTNNSSSVNTALCSNGVTINPYNSTIKTALLNLTAGLQYNGTSVNVPRVIGSSGTGSSSKGYMSLSMSLANSTNKLKVQWGWISVNADSTGTITFSSAFSGATSYAVILTQGPGASSSSTTTVQTDNYINGVYVTAKTASNFTYKTMTLKNWLQWIAIGV